MSVRVEAPGSRIERYAGTDEEELRCRVVEAPEEERRLVYLHGIESHGGWFLPAASRLQRRGVSSVLLDRRGSGLNLDKDPGHATSAAELLRDVRLLRARLGGERPALVGLSWGGKLALAAALEDPTAWSRLVLITPGLVPRVDLRWPAKLRLAWCWVFRPRAKFDVPIEPEMFTRTPRWLEYVRSDPLRLEHVTASFLRASVVLDRLVRARVESLRVPTLVLLAGADLIVDNEGTRRLLARAPAGLRSVEEFEGATHSIQFDCVDRLVERLDSFLREDAA